MYLFFSYFLEFEVTNRAIVLLSINCRYLCRYFSKKLLTYKKRFKGLKFSAHNDKQKAFCSHSNYRAICGRKVSRILQHV